MSDVAPFKLGVSAGHLCNLLIIAYTKRALAFPMPGGERLKLLENLNSMTDERYLTADILATIAPMSDSEIEMMDAALSLDGEGDKGGWASSRVLAKTIPPVRRPQPITRGRSREASQLPQVNNGRVEWLANRPCSKHGLGVVGSDQIRGKKQAIST